MCTTLFPKNLRNHTLFGEAAAILAGDNLLTWAFDLLSSSKNDTLTTQQRLAIIHIIVRDARPLGMVGAQELDIGNENTDFPFATLETIYKHTTGALIT